MGFLLRDCGRFVPHAACLSASTPRHSVRHNPCTGWNLGNTLGEGPGSNRLGWTMATLHVPAKIPSACHGVERSAAGNVLDKRRRSTTRVPVHLRWRVVGGGPPTCQVAWQCAARLRRRSIVLTRQWRVTGSRFLGVSSCSPFPLVFFVLGNGVNFAKSAPAAKLHRVLDRAGPDAPPEPRPGPVCLGRICDMDVLGDGVG